MIRSPWGDVPPEAREGAREPVDELRGDGGLDDDRSADLEQDEPGAAILAEAGLTGDVDRDAAEIGLAKVPSGSLLHTRQSGRERLLAEGGGDGATEGAVALALRWLAEHQEPDGSWSAETFERQCADGDACEGTADKEYAPAATGLALLPFLGAGHAHHVDGPWRETVGRGLAALVAMQREDGTFGSGQKRVYEDAIAAFALADAYELSRSAALRAPAQRAVDRFVDSQSSSGGWRYNVGDDSADTSVSGWVAMALTAARRGGLDVPEQTLYRCREFFESRTDDAGRVGYLARGRGPDALLGVGLAARVFLGAQAGDRDVAPIGRRLMGRSPEWPRDETLRTFGRHDPSHWYYGALGAYQTGGDTWAVWEPRLRKTLLPTQRRDGCAAGSWDPVGGHRPAGRTPGHDGARRARARGLLPLPEADRTRLSGTATDPRHFLPMCQVPLAAPREAPPRRRSGGGRRTTTRCGTALADRRTSPARCRTGGRHVHRRT